MIQITNIVALMLLAIAARRLHSAPAGGSYYICLNEPLYGADHERA
jgi:hypothetical protein